MSNKQITVFDLSDEQIEECFNGSTDIDLVRNLLARHWDKEENVVDVEGFGEGFARAIEGFVILFVAISIALPQWRPDWFKERIDSEKIN